LPATEEGSVLAERTAVSVDQTLLDRLTSAQSITDQLFAIVPDEFLYERPIPERHRIVFYIGHLEAFDWNLLRERILDKAAFDPKLDQLFAFGIDPVDGGLPTDQPSDWPPLKEVRQYVAHIRERLDLGLRQDLTKPDSDISRDSSVSQLLHVAVEHRLMHAETLAYMLHQSPLNQKVRPAHSPKIQTGPVLPGMIEIPPGEANLGLARAEGVFGWDNEFDVHTVKVPGFAIDRYKVTNGQFLEFIAAGGYENRALWSDDAWSWKEEAEIRHPVFWRRDGDQWLLRTMFEDLPLPPNWPVYVSHSEASAYARWVEKLLPTEAQWHRAAYGSSRTEGKLVRIYPWGSALPTVKHGNFDFQSWDPTPVNAFPAGDSAFGVSDLLGNGWEWTSTVFAPFEGFEPFSFYPGYSANFFDGKHFVMKGGSPRTAACMLRPSFRNWFQAHYQYVYAGFRCVREI
jgi:gamma-glutamyl hercynylcysteine S-oxide synthase